MRPDFIIRREEFEDENGVKLIVFKIRRRKRKNLQKNMMIAGIEIVSEAALAAYTWKSNFHPVWPLMVSGMGAVSVIAFYKNARRYIRKLPRLQIERFRLSWYFATGVITYFTSIHCFSEALKCNNKVWIPCLGVVVSGYHLAASSVTRLGRTVLNRSPFMKCCQLLFGPMLIGCAACYLSFRQHDEEWLFCLPMIASSFVANHITFVGYRRVESNNEPRWLLFKGIELFVGGCLLLLNGSFLVAYSVNNQFHPLFIGFCTTIVSNGVTDITSSLESLHDLVPQPVFKRYCQRVLGPVVTVYSSLAAAYVGYSMGWRFSLVMLPFIPAGIYTTYQGFRRRNRP
ncbi:unnamed protein product [Larinioides sclopetarius]|uniref:Uncharacterized protein n=1 Tax=Larinioides sclopetarius TaxID=280406 RepID=A0AAV2B2R5_9ARAC